MIEGLKTITGVLISIAPLMASVLGFDTSPDFTGDATEFAAALVTIAGAILALYGRAVAKTPGWFVRRAD